MKLYAIEVTETLQKTVKVYAATERDALSKVREAYDDCAIELTADHLMDTDVECVCTTEPDERKATMHLGDMRYRCTDGSIVKIDPFVLGGGLNVGVDCLTGAPVYLHKPARNMLYGYLASVQRESGSILVYVEAISAQAAARCVPNAVRSHHLEPGRIVSLNEVDMDVERKNIYKCEVCVYED